MQQQWDYTVLINLDGLEQGESGMFCDAAKRTEGTAGRGRHAMGTRNSLERNSLTQNDQTAFTCSFSNIYSVSTVMTVWSILWRDSKNNLGPQKVLTV